MNEPTADSPIEDVNKGIAALQWFQTKVRPDNLEEVYAMPLEELEEKIDSIMGMVPAVMWVIRTLGILEARSVSLAAFRQATGMDGSDDAEDSDA